MTGKYDHLFVKNMRNIDSDFVYEGDAAGVPKPANVGDGYGLMTANDFPGSKIHMSHVWITEASEPVLWVTEHVHDYDEILRWTGSNSNDPQDLGASIYLDIEGERHTITTSGAVYIPAGTKHCPLGFNSVTRPFTFSALSLDGNYSSDERHFDGIVG